MSIFFHSWPGEKVRRAFFMLKLLMGFFMLWVVCTFVHNLKTTT